MDNKILFAIPSKGRMYDETMKFLVDCGLTIKRNNRQYIGKILELPEIKLVFQRQEDVINGVGRGNFAFGITGFDLLSESITTSKKSIYIIHEALGFGICTLEVAVPEKWDLTSIQGLKERFRDQCIKVATKFPSITTEFFKKQEMTIEIVQTKGTIEVSPDLGYSDIIVDLVSTGRTIQDNRLKILSDGRLLSSQAIFIANKELLKNKNILTIAIKLLEYFEGRIRGKSFVSVIANVKGKSGSEIAEKMFLEDGLKGLQGPTIANVYTKDNKTWYSVHIIIEREKLTQSISALRNIGGSGIVVSPTLFIFEEESERYKNLLAVSEDGY